MLDTYLYMILVDKSTHRHHVYCLITFPLKIASYGLWSQVVSTCIHHNFLNWKNRNRTLTYLWKSESCGIFGNCFSFSSWTVTSVPHEPSPSSSWEPLVSKRSEMHTAINLPQIRTETMIRNCLTPKTTSTIGY